MIFLDTNVISETFKPKPSEAVTAWIIRFEIELAISTVVLGEVLYGIRKIHPDPRAARWEVSLSLWRSRLAGNIHSYQQDDADAYGSLMANAAKLGRPIAPPDAMIAAVAMVNGGKLATRNIRHFEGLGLELINPWEF
ncbi:MAG: PIN domain-containing protein [Rhizobiaceae bacterium]